MIKKIKIFSRAYMDDFANGSKEFPYKDKNWNLVSIYGDGDAEFLTESTKDVLRELGCKDFISLNFWDIVSREQYPGGILFHKGQAKEIVDFVKGVQEDGEDSIFVAHCMAGISRSGAVGSFTCDYYGLDYEEFLKDNPFNFANPHVLKLLQAEANMGEKFEWHDGVAPADPKLGLVISPP